MQEVFDILKAKADAGDEILTLDDFIFESVITADEGIETSDPAECTKACWAEIGEFFYAGGGAVYIPNFGVFYSQEGHKYIGFKQERPPTDADSLVITAEFKRLRKAIDDLIGDPTLAVVAVNAG